MRSRLPSLVYIFVLSSGNWTVRVRVGRDLLEANFEVEVSDFDLVTEASLPVRAQVTSSLYD